MLLLSGIPYRRITLEAYTQHRLIMDAILRSFIVINAATPRSRREI
ncbi:MAG: hypothetical protein H6750_14680 [Nitrospiraceae bacterium]|nr:hypothetical protein [Nitrospira sp.]MCB9775553.1 hypothetical protein [Nitrospiraceae bacterium]